MRGTFNIRLSESEKRQLKMQAKLRGFRSLGAYIRYRLLHQHDVAATKEQADAD